MHKSKQSHFMDISNGMIFLFFFLTKYHVDACLQEKITLNKI